MDENCLSDDEGPRAKRYKQMRKQDLLEELLEQRRTLNVQEAKLREQEALMEKLKGMMECPVCLSVPVEVPASQHQDECDHRIVVCPGIEDCYEEYLPFCGVDGGAHH